MFSSPLIGNLWPYPLSIFLFITNFPTPSVPLPFDGKNEINAKQTASVTIRAEPFDTRWLIPLFFVIIPLTLDFCHLLVVLVAHPRPRVDLQSPLIFKAASTAPQGGLQHEVLVPLRRRPDVEAVIAPAEPGNLTDSIRRHSQDNQVETIHEDSGLPTPRTPESITFFRTTPFDNGPHTAAGPTVRTTFTPSATPTAEEVNSSHECAVDGAATHPSISSPTPSSLIDDDLNCISRCPSHNLGEEGALASPAESTRPPTYRTCASGATISTLPLYQENEGDRLSRVSSRRPASTTIARRERPVLPPPLPLPSFPIQKS